MSTNFGEPQPCLEYEYVEGGDLAGFIQELHRNGHATADTIAHWMLHLTETVAFAHSLKPPLVHRDLKPANVLVQRSDDGTLRLRVTDFGISEVAAVVSLGDGGTRGEAATVVPGAYTALYASPQQIARAPADPRDDVHALGVIWYQMLTGDLTRGRPSGSSWRRQLAARGVDAAPLDLLEACMDDEAGTRPDDANDLNQRLQALLSPSTGRTVPAEARRSSSASGIPQSQELLSRPSETLESGSPPIPGKKGSYVLWLEPPHVQTPRFVHFSWGGPGREMSFKIRDYVGGRRQYHPGGNKPDDPGFEVTECRHDRDAVWRAATERIQATGELTTNVDDFVWWWQKLEKMTADRVGHIQPPVDPRWEAAKSQLLTLTDTGVVHGGENDWLKPRVSHDCKTLAADNTLTFRLTHSPAFQDELGWKSAPTVTMILKRLNRLPEVKLSNDKPVRITIEAVPVREE